MAETDRSDSAEHSELSSIATTTADPPALLGGVEPAICRVLGIKNLRHRSALLELGKREGLPRGAVGAMFAVIAANWGRCRAAQPLLTSSANWRWRSPQTAIAPQNKSAEVVFERAVVRACEELKRCDWSNQVPVASGIAGSSRDRRRAIDLVHQRSPGRFEFIELKVASDTPLFAAFEIIAYTCIWLLSRREAGEAHGPLLTATEIDARVLAPAAYYARYDLSALAALLDQELSALGSAHGVKLSFGFDALGGDISPFPSSDNALMALVDRRRPI